jgi:hypothetical protein
LDSTLQLLGRAQIVVLPRVLGAANNIYYVHAALTPVSRPLDKIPRAGTVDTSGFRVVQTDTTGPHVLHLAGIGYARFVDTLIPRRGYSDTIVVWLRPVDEEYRNTYNCRPRGFRRSGESACVSDTVETEAALSRAREFAGDGVLKALGIAPGDSSTVTLVGDEKTCRRAAALYGQPKDPPRRIVVIRMGKHYLVYDPYEPLPAGEWNVYRVFDRRWRPVLDIFG